MQKFKYLMLFLICVFLSINIFSYASNPNGDATGNTMFLLGILGFPLSIIPTMLTLILVGYIVTEANNTFTFAGICLAYFLFCLIQWFWLLPKIINRYKSLE